MGDVVTPGPDSRPCLAPGPDPGPGTVPISARGAGCVFTPRRAKEDYAGNSLTDPTIIIIDDDDNEVENADTLVMLRDLSVSAAAPSCGSANGSIKEKSGRTSPTNSVIIIDDDDFHDTRPVSCVCSATTNNNAVPFSSPETMRKQVAVTDAKPRSTKTKSARSKGKKQVVDNDKDSKRGEMLINPFSLGSTRKRRPEIDYNHVPKYEVYDRSDEEDHDFEYEERDDDKRLDQVFEKGYPVLDTPSKRQKTKK